MRGCRASQTRWICAQAASPVRYCSNSPTEKVVGEACPLTLPGRLHITQSPLPSGADFQLMSGQFYKNYTATVDFYSKTTVTFFRPKVNTLRLFIIGFFLKIWRTPRSCKPREFTVNPLDARPPL